MSLPKGTTVTLYAQEPELKEPDPEPFMYMLDKWEKFDEALGSEVDVVAIAFPEVLGDAYSELIINLGKLAQRRHYGRRFTGDDTSHTSRRRGHRAETEPVRVVDALSLF